MICERRDIPRVCPIDELNKDAAVNGVRQLTRQLVNLSTKQNLLVKKRPYRLESQPRREMWLGFL